MDLEARRLLAAFDAAEGLVKKCSIAAAEAQRAVRAAVEDREQANNAVARLIRDSGGSAISFLGSSYWLDDGGLVRRTPTTVDADSGQLATDPYPNTFLLRRWQPTTEDFGYVGRNDHDIETTVAEKERAYHFVTMPQVQRFRSERRRWRHFEIASSGDPIGPPIDAEVEEPTAEQIAEAVNGRDLSDAEIDTDAAAYAAVEKVFGEAHGLGSDEGESRREQ